MAIIDGRKFERLLHRYKIADDVMEDVKSFILKSYTPDIVVGNTYYQVKVKNQSTSKLPLNEKIKFFELVITYCNIAAESIQESNPEIQITYTAAKELSKKEFEKRKSDTLKYKRKYINPVEIKEGKTVFNLACTEADNDWLRAGRLKKLVDEGDETARKELFRMENSLMFTQD